jgi:hypothetical protein
VSPTALKRTFLFSSPGLIYNAGCCGEKHQQRRKRINQHIILRSHFLMAIKFIPAIWGANGIPVLKKVGISDGTLT